MGSRLGRPRGRRASWHGHRACGTLRYGQFARATRGSLPTRGRPRPDRSRDLGPRFRLLGGAGRLRGYETFLKLNPQWHGKVVFIISVAPSRIGVDSYQAMKLELEQTVGRFNGFVQMTDRTSISETVLHLVTVMTGSNCRALCSSVRVWDGHSPLARAK